MLGASAAAYGRALRLGFALRQARRSRGCACGFPQSEPEPGHPEAVLLNTAGGLTGGDRMRHRGVAGGDAEATLNDGRRGEDLSGPRQRRVRHRRKLTLGRMPASPGCRSRPSCSTGAARPAHRCALAARRAPSRGGNRDLRPPGHGRGRAQRRLPRRLACAARRRAGVRRHVAHRRRRRRRARPAGRLDGARAVAMLLYVAAERRARLEQVRALFDGAKHGGREHLERPDVVRADAPRTDARCRAISHLLIEALGGRAAAARVAVLSRRRPRV